MRVYLAREGITISDTTILKYMREFGIKSTIQRKRPGYKKGECYKKFDNQLDRNFEAVHPNEKWCTDFTYIFLDDGRKRYNCSILDLYDKSIVATKNSNHMDTQLAIDTLKLALVHTNYPKNVLLHSDQGSQYTSRTFIEFCNDNNIIQSMSKSGCPYDNSAMESFYGTLRCELLNKYRFLDDESLNDAIMRYVYDYYNEIRPHSSNGYLTPNQKRNNA